MPQKTSGKNKKYGRNKRAASTKMQTFRTARNKERNIKRNDKAIAFHVTKWLTRRKAKQVRGYARRNRRQHGAVAV